MRFPALLIALILASTAVYAGRPNIVIILADDLGFSDLGCYGGEVPTPHIDRLASNGARFSAFYTSARCCPSRASLMTGLHPHQAGIGSFANAKPRKGWGSAYTGHLLPTCATIGEMLGDSGYSTWMVGKWHMGIPGPIKRGFSNYYGYKNFLAHSENQWDPAKYVRLPEGTKPEIKHDPESFFVTDVFSDYALEFLDQAHQKPDQPFLLYLAHSSPHFPIQAPKSSIDKHVDTYRRGWDELRAERLGRMKKLGVVSQDLPLPPKSKVPVDRDDIANGFSGEPNPDWDSLPEDRRDDLARRMATFAAMVEHVDAGIGRVIANLEKNGALENTLIFFLADNGACYEWGPFGFDGRSRTGVTILHSGDTLANMGQADTHSSYGSGWANLGNTPLNSYKHFCHEGGIASPLIAHWPMGIKAKGTWVRDPAHLMDIVPTILEATGAVYPKERAGHEITPVEGTSLLPAINGTPLPERTLAFEHQQARGLRKGDWKVVWGKRQRDVITWELYNLADDRSEQKNLAAERPELTQSLSAAWDDWAKTVGAEPFLKDSPASSGPAKFEVESPLIAGRELVITADVESLAHSGVVLAQGGREQGYALHFVDGKPAFDVRVDGKVTRLLSETPVKGKIRLVAVLADEMLTLTVNDLDPISVKSPGLIRVEPKDPLTVGFDTQTAAGDYEAPNRFEGIIISTLVTPSGPSGQPAPAP